MTDGDVLPIRIVDNAANVIPQSNKFLRLHVIQFVINLMIDDFASTEQTLVVAVSVLHVTDHVASGAQLQVRFAMRVACEFAAAAAFVATTTNFESASLCHDVNPICRSCRRCEMKATHQHDA